MPAETLIANQMHEDWIAAYEAEDARLKQQMAADQAEIERFKAATQRKLDDIRAVLREMQAERLQHEALAP